MYDCLLQELLLRYKEKIEELLTIKGSLLVKIRNLITGLLVTLENDADYRASTEVFLNADKTEEYSRVLKGLWDYQKLLKDRLASLIEQGIEAGEIRPESLPDPAALVLLKSVDGLVVGTFGANTLYSLKKMADGITDFLLRGIIEKYFFWFGLDAHIYVCVWEFFNLRR